MQVICACAVLTPCLMSLCHEAQLPQRLCTCLGIQRAAGKLQTPEAERAGADVKNRRGNTARGRKITGMQFLPQDPSQLLITSNDSRVRLYEGEPPHTLCPPHAWLIHIRPVQPSKEAGRRCCTAWSMGKEWDPVLLAPSLEVQ